MWRFALPLLGWLLGGAIVGRAADPNPIAPSVPTPEQLKVYESLAPAANDPAFGDWMQKYLADAKDLKSQMQVFCASLTDLE